MSRYYKTYQGDPYWTKARFTSKCTRCGAVIPKGSDIFYYPKGKYGYCSDPNCGGSESNSFQYAAEFEDTVKMKLGKICKIQDWSKIVIIEAWQSICNNITWIEAYYNHKRIFFGSLYI